MGSLSMEVPWKRARTSSSSSSSSITDLPSHVLMEILLRLPIKTLVASKCVRKSWLHLIEDPQFSKMHLSRAANVEICFFLNSFEEKRILQLYTGNSSFHNFDLKLMTTLLQLPKFNDMSSLVFANSCNGLLCYRTVSQNFAFIWNPITSELIKIPPPTSIASYRGYGLGFSQNSNRFKILCVFQKKTGSADEIVAEICTIEKGCSWKAVGSCPYANWNYIAPVFFRGALHWVGEDNPSPLYGKEYDPISNMRILSFDFEEEEFGSVPLPPHFVDFKLISSKIGVLGGCLFVTETTGQCFNIWLMKEYGDRDSWTQVISLNFTPAERFYYRMCEPIHYLDSGEILMIHISMYLFTYNPVLKSVGPPHHFGRMVKVITFNPSLVPLKQSMMGYRVHTQ